jgi:hypothetical protein
MLMPFIDQRKKLREYKNKVKTQMFPQVEPVPMTIKPIEGPSQAQSDVPETIKA